MKKLILITSLLIAVNGFGQDLDCLEYNGKTYPANEYTQRFIKNVVNRNASSCDSMTVKTAARMLKKKINVKVANPKQQAILQKAIEARREARIKKKLIKAGLLSN